MFKTRRIPAPETDSATLSVQELSNAETPTRFRQYEETIRRSVILAILYLAPAVWILHPVIFDADIWWHLQTGRWIVDHGQLPNTDPFSAYGEGKPWFAYSWLFEIGMYELVQWCGERGILLYTLLGTWLAMLSIHRLIGKRFSDFVVVVGLMTVSLLTLSKLFTPRPWLLTIVCFAVTLEVVLSLREGKRCGWFWALPLIYLVWANIHIQFIYGLGLLGLACTAPLIDKITQPYTGTRPTMAWGDGSWKRLATLTLACVVATLLTPHHVRLYSIVVELAAQTGMWEYTQEMQALPFRSVGDWAVLGLFAVTLVLIGWKRSFSAFDVLLMTAAAISAFRGQRDVWFLTLSSVAVLASLWGTNQSRILPMISRKELFAACCMVALGVSVIFAKETMTEQKVRDNTAKIFPVEAADFVNKRRYKGPLYNNFDWGGYLIWRLPQLKVSMDGRANVHGDERIKESIATWDGKPGWDNDLELDEAGLVIARRSDSLTSLLKRDRRFEAVYEDETSVVFIKASRQDGESSSLDSATVMPEPMLAAFGQTR